VELRPRKETDLVDRMVWVVDQQCVVVEEDGLGFRKRNAMALPIQSVLVLAHSNRSSRTPTTTAIENWESRELVGEVRSPLVHKKSLEFGQERRKEVRDVGDHVPTR
jgi:hypothetical protein